MLICFPLFLLVICVAGGMQSFVPNISHQIFWVFLSSCNQRAKGLMGSLVPHEFCQIMHPLRVIHHLLIFPKLSWVPYNRSVHRLRRRLAPNTHTHTQVMRKREDLWPGSSRGLWRSTDLETGQLRQQPREHMVSVWAWACVQLARRRSLPLREEPPCGVREAYRRCVCVRVIWFLSRNQPTRWNPQLDTTLRRTSLMKFKRISRYQML